MEMKFMRLFRRIVVGFFIIIIVVPLCLGGLMLIKDDVPPTYLKNFDYENYDGEEVILNKLNSLAIANILGKNTIYIEEKTVNKIIYKELANNKSEDNEVDFLEAFWVNFDDDKLTMYALFKYRSVSTTVTISIGVKDTSDSLKLSLDKFKVGKLPILKPLFSWALDNYAQSLNEDYKYGEINYEELYITVLDSYIQDILKNNLGTDIINFNGVKLENGKFYINYQFNQENADAVAIQNAIDELNKVITDGSLLSDVSDVLDETDDTQMQFKEYLDSVIELLQTKIETDDIDDLTDEEIDLFSALSDSYSKLDESMQEDVLGAFEANLDSTIVNNLNVALNNIGVSGYDNIADLLIGVGE